MRVGPLAPVNVTVATVREDSFVPEISGIGTVEARRSWLLGPTLAGRVLSVKVDVGDTVKAGQILAEMDPVDLDQRLRSLDAAIERAASAQASAAAQQADAAARRELAASSLRRNQDLAERNFISSGALETFVQARASADAALDSARANAAGASQDLARARADREALVRQRASSQLIAASDGVVSARDAEPGSTVVAGQPVLRLVDPSSLWVKLRVDQGRASGLVQGLRARMALRSHPGDPVTGVVTRMELLGDSVTEERIAQLSFDRIPAGVAVGEMVEASVKLAAIGPSLVVPAASIQRRAGTTGVWRMDAGKPVFARVRPGAASADGRVQILEGLGAGDKVVVYSARPLAAGSRVQVVDSLVAPGAAAGARE
jgi:HlyD family secretion protein